MRAETHVLDSPHIFLDEIMRQAQESEIIRLSMAVRDNKMPQVGKGTEVNTILKKDVVSGMYTWADQIICGRNDTRKMINNQMRKIIWGEVPPVPLPQDRIICTKNNWDYSTEAGETLVNGLQGKVVDIHGATSPFKALESIYYLTFEPSSYEEDNPLEQLFFDLPIDWQLICEGKPTINKKNFNLFPKNFHLEQFEYGYAITTWKSQGSEWDKVLFFAEPLSFLSKEDYIKYLYTGVTRASGRLTLVI